MRPYKIAMFIMGTLLTILVVSLLFPSEGITIGATQMDFPSAESIIGLDYTTAEEESEAEEEESEED